MNKPTRRGVEEKDLTKVNSSVLSEDQTLINETNPREATQVVLDDWSQTKRGSHVDFKDNETVPLTQGRFLGRGAVGDVHETTIQGWKLAHKKIHFRRRIDDNDKREIEILKRLSHVHMVQLVGTYTQQRILGILLYPVAVCDLHTFFEDVKAWTTTKSETASFVALGRITRLQGLEIAQKERLAALGYDFSNKQLPGSASPVYSQIGCLISAVAYLHDQKIRHKDLKPSNILLSRDRLWLSDFGSATDFTLLSQSATDNERGTPRYFSPEMAEWKPNGRASDIFSLGCVLLEVMVLHQTGNLNSIRRNRSHNSSFHANLDRIDTWLHWSEMNVSHRDYLLRWEIRAMLSSDPAKRPTAKELLASVTGSDIGRGDQSSPSIFGECCRGALVSRQEHEEQILRLMEKIKTKNHALHKFGKSIDKLHRESAGINEEYSHLHDMLRQCLKKRDEDQIRISELSQQIKLLSNKLDPLKKTGPTRSRQETERLAEKHSPDRGREHIIINKIAYPYTSTSSIGYTGTYHDTSTKIVRRPRPRSTSDLLHSPLGSVRHTWTHGYKPANWKSKSTPDLSWGSHKPHRCQCQTPLSVYDTFDPRDSRTGLINQNSSSSQPAVSHETTYPPKRRSPAPATRPGYVHREPRGAREVTPTDWPRSPDDNDHLKTKLSEKQRIIKPKKVSFRSLLTAAFKEGRKGA